MLLVIVLLLRIGTRVVNWLVTYMSILRMTVRAGIRTVKGMMHGVFMEVNWLDIMLVIKSVVKRVVVLVYVLVLMRHLLFLMHLWEVFVTLLHPVIKITVVVVLYRSSIVMLQVNVEVELAHRVIVLMVLLLFTVVVSVMLGWRRRDRMIQITVSM